MVYGLIYWSLLGANFKHAKKMYNIVVHVNPSVSAMVNVATVSYLFHAGVIYGTNLSEVKSSKEIASLQAEIK